MDASTILNMIKEGQLADAEELACFLEPTTDMYLLLKGLELLPHGFNFSELFHSSMAYAAVHQPEQFKHFVYEVHTLEVIDQMKSLSANEDSIACQHINAIYTPNIKPAFVAKAKAYIAKHGTVGLTESHKMLGTMEELFMPLGFIMTHRYSWDGNGIGAVEFRETWPIVCKTGLFFTNHISDNRYNYNGNADSPKEYMAFRFDVNVPAQMMAHVYKAARAGLKEKIKRMYVSVSVIGMYKKGAIQVEYKTSKSHLRGTRTTTIEMIDATDYPNLLEAEAIQFLFKGLSQPKVIKARVKYTTEDRDEHSVMEWIIGEGAEELEKDANGRVSPKPVIDADTETHLKEVTRMNKPAPEFKQGMEVYCIGTLARIETVKDDGSRFLVLFLDGDAKDELYDASLKELEAK
jgi:hypothetical protein